MNNILILGILISILGAYHPSEESPIPNNAYGSNTSFFINFSTENLELDGVFEVQTKSGLFLELWGNSQINSDVSLNTSLGIMNQINSKFITVGGYSNYIENNFINHEVFLGMNVMFFTAINFISLERGDLLFNYLGIIDINSLVSQLPFDLTLSGISSTELEERGNDFFINFSKTFQSGLYLGYTFSRERYEDEQIKTFTYIKDGEAFTKKRFISIPEESFFNTLSIGITF